jgi:putative alpha-1,2-mannosidase
VAGQDLYMITTPMFDNVTLNLGGDKKLIIICNGLNAKNVYIRSAKLNGKKLDRSWFTHTEIKNGAQLEFEMSDKPSDWATKPLDTPVLKY